MSLMTVDGCHTRLDLVSMVAPCETRSPSQMDSNVQRWNDSARGADFYGKNTKELRFEFKKPCKFFLKFAKKKASSSESVSQASSTCVFRPSDTSSLPSRLRLRARALTCWRKKPCADE
jgi:hypothetical protein